MIDQDVALSLGLQERGKEWYLCAMAPPICVGEGKALEDAEPRLISQELTAQSKAETPMREAVLLRF